MSTTSRVIDASPEQVFDVLADGWMYAAWVVGAAHTRDVDPSWPATGARLHHRVGLWPVNIDDQTSVTEVVPGRLLELHASAWPLGAARVRLELEPTGDGQTRVRMTERLTSRMGSRLPDAVQATVLTPRNQESLRRLDDIVVHRAKRR